MTKCRNKYKESLDVNLFGKLYLIDKYSIKDMSDYFRIPPTWVRSILKDLHIPQRSLKEAANTSKRKQKAEESNIKKYGSRHNFCKSHPSRKLWESRLLNNEGITNVFQRQAVIDKIKQTKIEHYGDDWKWQHAKVNFIEHYIEKYGPEIGPIKYCEVCRKKGLAFNRAHYVELYGTDEGLRKFNDLVSKRRQPIHFNGLNDKFSNMLDNYAVRYEREFFLPSPKHAYHYDFKINNIIIELNGTYWHLDPRKYKADDYVKFPNNRFILARDKWEYDKEKINWAQSQGYIVEVIWESDLNESVLNDILNKHNIIQNGKNS